MVSICTQIHATELREEIEAGFKANAFDEFHVDLSFVEEQFSMSKEVVLGNFQKNEYYQYIEDPSKNMEKWPCFQELDESEDYELDDYDDYDDSFTTYQEPYIRVEPKIGRNDPCKCGSGKKYKKCCLGNKV